MLGSAASLVAGVLMSGNAAAAASAGDRLLDIEMRGSLDCGIWPHLPGFAIEHDGRYTGFDVDLCRAVAAAVLGDATKVRFVALESLKQFQQRDDVDLVVRRLTWTLGRETTHRMAFGPVTFYDGQGFLVPKNGGITNASQLAGDSVCVLNEERHAEALYSYFRDSGHEVRAVLVDGDQEAEAALRAGHCRAYSADISWLAAARWSFADGVARYDILPELISKEPLAPLMRAADHELLQVVRWTIYSMIEAEELGLSSGSFDAMRSRSRKTRRFAAIHPGAHVALGAGDWVRAIIVQVGNYGEIFDHNLGAESPIRLDRGLNRLWSQGGLLYAPPLDR